MTTTKNGDCGCGCGGGGKASAPVAGAAAHVRPRFFAGQLLTEDDLGLLAEYVAGKNRLHNRAFLGEGVVCGLEVTCDPCGDGHVSVRPGYALDCCGNDIVVPCAQTVDIMAMAHRLRVESLGIDCGDPCAGGEHKGGEEASERGVVVKPARRRYGLYVSYAEEDTDPVAPYATGEACGEQGCTPTRTRETYALSLRCEVERRPPDDALARILHCVKEFRELVAKAGGTKTWGQLAGPAATAVQVARGRERLEFAAADADALKTGLEAASEPIGAEPDVAAVRASLDRLRTLVMTSAKLNALEPDDRAKAIDVYKIADQAARAKDVASAAAERLRPHLAMLPDPVERDTARALLGGAGTWTDPDLEAKARAKLAHLLAVQGAALDHEVLRLISGNLATVRDRLLAKLDGATLTDCRLRRDVEAIQIPVVVEPPDEGEDDDGEVYEARFTKSVVDTSSAARSLASALIRYVAGCMCAALLPPCRPCDDTGVLLAAIEVEDCEVVHICNLERTIPLTGTALAHWVPVEHLARLLDEICCVLPRTVGELVRPIGKGSTQALPAEERTVAASPQPRMFSAAPGALDSLEPVATVLEAAGVAPALRAEVSRAVGRLPELEALRAAVEPARPVPGPEVARLEALERRLGDVTTLKREVINLRKQVKTLTGGG